MGRFLEAALRRLFDERGEGLGRIIVVAPKARDEQHPVDGLTEQTDEICIGEQLRSDHETFETLPLQFNRSPSCLVTGGEGATT